MRCCRTSWPKQLSQQTQQQQQSGQQPACQALRGQMMAACLRLAAETAGQITVLWLHEWVLGWGQWVQAWQQRWLALLWLPSPRWAWPCGPGCGAAATQMMTKGLMSEQQ
jgi:hypothetical protein